MMMVIKNKKRFDWQIVIYLLVLLFIGILSVYSASTTKTGDVFETENTYVKQIIWICVGLFVLFLILLIPYHFIEIIIIPGYILTNLLLILVLFLPSINGSHRWIALGPFYFQPSELAKVFAILMVAKFISKEHISDVKIIFRTILILLPVFFLVALEPDLGTALTLVFVGIVMASVSDLQTIWLILLLSPVISILLSFSSFVFFIFLILLVIYLYKSRLSILGILFSTIINLFLFMITPVFWNQLKHYQQERILTFLDPSRDPFGAGYQIIQAKIAIGSGGLFGKGFLQGTQKNLQFLPEHHTDFIFSVIGEEFGFFGCAILLLFYFVFLYRIAVSIKYLKRKEIRYSAVGILAYITFQFLINIGMNIGIMPTTGIPLPFISYGGSNLVVNMISIGLIMKFLLERSVFD
jgi:rod shape determining protein RodA